MGEVSYSLHRQFLQKSNMVRNLALRFLESDETDMAIDMEGFVDVWTPICEQVYGVQDITSLNADSTFSVRSSQSKDRKKRSTSYRW